eukprot:3115441-Rhodomonas_salina.1
MSVSDIGAAKVRRSFCIGNDKLVASPLPHSLCKCSVLTEDTQVYLLDSKREVHDELPKNEE